MKTCCQQDQQRMKQLLPSPLFHNEHKLLRLTYTERQMHSYAPQMHLRCASVRSIDQRDASALA